MASAAVPPSPTFTQGARCRARASANSPSAGSATRSADFSLRPRQRSRAEVAEPAPQRVGWDPAPRQGWVAPHIASEFPGLGIASVEVDAKPGRSPEPVRRRLRDLADRTYGAEAIRLRERPIPWAYRVFYRQIGLDPDRTRTAIEQLTLDRLHDGGFRSKGLPADALDIAIVETGVTLRAFDADRLEGGLCIRDSAPGESLAGQSAEMARGTLTIADERRP